MSSQGTEATKINSVTTRTIWGALIQTCMFGHFRIPDIKYISMNERLNVQKDAKAPPGTYPFFKYWVIGDKGHVNRIDATDNETYIDEAKHHGDDAAPFRPIPFVMRAEGNDLTPEERAQYCLRRMEDGPDNKRYWCYYGKPIPNMESITPKVEYTTVIDGVENTREYETSNANLYPQQSVIPPDGQLTTNSAVLTVVAGVTIEFTAKDAQELMNVARLRYNGNEKRAVISEIGLCTGVDADIQTETDGGAPIKFKEAIQVWIATFITTFQSLAFNTKGFRVELELGATEPVMSGTEVPTDQQVDALNQARRSRLNGVSASVYLNK